MWAECHRGGGQVAEVWETWIGLPLETLPSAGCRARCKHVTLGRPSLVQPLSLLCVGCTLFLWASILLLQSGDDSTCLQTVVNTVGCQSACFLLQPLWIKPSCFKVSTAPPGHVKVKACSQLWIWPNCHFPLPMIWPKVGCDPRLALSHQRFLRRLSSS